MAKKGFLPNAKSAGNKQASWVDEMFASSGSKDGLDANWNAVNPMTILTLVWCASELGGNVQFSVNKKGTAYCIKFYLGEPREPMYFDGNEEGRADMDQLAQSFAERLAESV